jgi:hypothetical protein
LGGAGREDFYVVDQLTGRLMKEMKEMTGMEEMEVTQVMVMLAKMMVMGKMIQTVMVMMMEIQIIIMENSLAATHSFENNEYIRH